MADARASGWRRRSQGGSERSAQQNKRERAARAESGFPGGGVAQHGHVTPTLTESRAVRNGVMARHGTCNLDEPAWVWS